MRWQQQCSLTCRVPASGSCQVQPLRIACQAAARLRIGHVPVESRDATEAAFILDEIVTKQCYTKAGTINLQPGDTVVDVGAQAIEQPTEVCAT